MAKRDADGVDLTVGSARMGSLEGFVLERVLLDAPDKKALFLLGRFKDITGEENGKRAIVILAKRHFETETSKVEQLSQTALQSIFTNDIYSKYGGTPPPSLNEINVDIICPCTDKHIAKYSKQETFIVRETPELYALVTLPYILSLPATTIQWVYNILEKKKEVERLLYEDPDAAQGFMLHPDLKWDQKQASELYCLAICHNRDLRSVRDLRQEHLPLLENIKTKSCQFILDKYGIMQDKLRIYLHYQPSYYHLHVHFTHVDLFGPGQHVGKAILLDDVMNNLVIDPDYYLKSTLSYTLGSEMDLYKAMQSHLQK